MSYDLLMVGGSGAQFGLAVLQCTGLGFSDLPRAMYVIDADKGFYQKLLMPALADFAKQTVDYLNHVAEGKAAQVALPQLKHVMPYSDPKPQFTVIDLIKGAPMSRLAQVCLTDDEASYPIDEGLYGMAKLGGVILADRAARKDDARLRGEQGLFPDALIAELKAAGDKSAPIFIVGSVAGGTGAGFMAPLLKSIRTTRELSDRKVHVFSFLPWFDLPASGRAIGPDNTRMALNASQGIRFLQDTLDEVTLAAEQKTLTMVHVIGLPDGARKPRKEGEMHVAAPGPMMYYAAALLSKGLDKFNDVAFQLESGVYSWACNPVGDGKGALRGRVQFKVPELGAGNDNLGDGLIPFEAVVQVLEVTCLAIDTLTLNRFKSAFGIMSDSPEYLPRVLFNAIKAGRAGTSDRIAVGGKIRQQLDESRQVIQRQIKNLQAAQATVAGESVTVYDAREWGRDLLSNVVHLDLVLSRNKNLLKLLTNAIGQDKADIAADLIVRALVRGLALGEGGATARALQGTFPRAASTIVALPGQAPQNVQPVPNTPFVRLNAEAVDKLGQTLAAAVAPDSQSQPSALARARICRYLVEPARLPDDSSFPVGLPLAETEVGRLLLVWLGLASGRWSICERQRLEGADLSHLNSFDRAVSVFETKSGPRPYRSSWVSFVVAKKTGEPFADSDIVAASSPQTGWFTSVRTNEGDKKTYQSFRDLAQYLDSGQLWDWLKMAFRGWLDLVRADGRCAQVGAQPWYRMLRLFAGADTSDSDRAKFGQFVWCSVGPVPLQVDGAMGTASNATVIDMSLPMLIDPAEREAIVCALGGAATQAYEPQPLCAIQQRDGMVELLLNAQGRTRTLLTLRAPQALTSGLNFEQDLQVGAFAFHDWTGCAGLPNWQTGFRPQFQARAAQKFGPAFREKPLELGHILAMFGDRPEFAQNFGIDAARFATLVQLGTKLPPFRPGIVNLFNGAQLI